MTPNTLGRLALVTAVVACSASGVPDQQVGTEGAGGNGGGGAWGAGGTTSIKTDGGLTNPLTVNIQHKQIEVKFITLGCEGSCADVVAVVSGGRPPYTFAWEDGSADPARRVCPTADTVYEVAVTDTGSCGEICQPPKTVRTPLTADVVECPDSGPPPPDGGSCNVATPLEELTPDIFGTPAYFSGGASLPAGRYRVNYVDGCMKYDANWAWTVQGAPTFQYVLIGASTADVLGVLPGTLAPIAFGVYGYLVFDDCVAANRALAPLDFDFGGGQLGLWQNDFKADDNLGGVRNPTWRLSRLDACP